jgi:RNA polymerase sigma-70 factor (ECF subfamily)
MSRQGDNELVQATLAGDGQAYEELVARYEAPVYNVALRITGNIEDAMDATQAAFLKAFDHLSAFDSKHRFFSWIYRIGLNEALSLVKVRRRFIDLDHEPPQREADPERRCRASEAGRGIEEALADLKPDYRAVIVLRHLQGLSYDEIAEVTGVPAKTVKSRLFTARRALRLELTRRGFWG